MDPLGGLKVPNRIDQDSLPEITSVTSKEAALLIEGEMDS